MRTLRQLGWRLLPNWAWKLSLQIEFSILCKIWKVLCGKFYLKLFFLEKSWWTFSYTIDVKENSSITNWIQEFQSHIISLWLLHHGGRFKRLFSFSSSQQSASGVRSSVISLWHNRLPQQNLRSRWVWRTETSFRQQIIPKKRLSLQIFHTSRVFSIQCLLFWWFWNCLLTLVKFLVAFQYNSWWKKNRCRKNNCPLKNVIRPLH